MIMVKTMEIFSCNQICGTPNMAEIRGSYPKVSEPCFILILYTWFSHIKKVRNYCECSAVAVGL